MSKFAQLLILLLLGTALGACSGGRFFDPDWTGVQGSGRVITETRDASGFQSIVVNDLGARLFVEQTGRDSLSITTDDNIMPNVVTEVRGATLYVQRTPNYGIQRTTDLVVKVTVQKLDGLEVDGAVIADIKGVDTDQFEVKVSGASIIKLSGKADRQNVTLSGTGRYDADSLQVRRASINHSGAGVATLRVSESLDAEISGLGYVEYIGDPVVNKNITGVGAVRRR